ncbi:MAG: hypothetical protein KGD73_12180 [Candidatus Lokiarchaeota archaeon]|nr:hypothetical protein [Candidatus Lokiarchaeota archaeon]
MASEADHQEFDLESKRITVNVDEVTDKIIENLIGVKGKSKSSVVYQIVKDWIDHNSENMLDNWGVNFSLLRQQVLSKYKILPEEGKVINQLVKYFETIKSITAEELAAELNLEVKQLRNFIFSNNKKLKDAGLKLIYENGKFYPE